MPRIAKLLPLPLMALLLMASGTSRAELEITISRGVDKAMPVAIVPFGYSGGGAAPATDVAGIVAANLQRSGRFAPLDRRDMLQRPTRGEEVDFRSWRAVGVDALLVGELLRTGPDQYNIRFQLFDALRGEQLLGFQLPSTEAALRASSHRVADLVYEKLTGVPGIFSTRGRPSRRRH